MENYRLSSTEVLVINYFGKECVADINSTHEPIVGRSYPEDMKQAVWNRFKEFMRI